MDDLREWCIRQKCSIPVYLNRPTYNTVAGAFPYMVDKSQASGGGDVQVLLHLLSPQLTHRPSLIFNIIDDLQEFDISGIKIHSFPSKLASRNRTLLC
jgi:hypothetical protein